MSGRVGLAVAALWLSIGLLACSPASPTSTPRPLPTSTAAPTQGTWPNTSPRQTVAHPSGEPTALTRQTARPADVPVVAEADQLEFVLAQAVAAGMHCEPHNVGGLHLCRAQLSVVDESYSTMLVEGRDGKVVDIEASASPEYADDDEDQTGTQYYSGVQQLVDTIDAVKWSLFDADVAKIDALVGDKISNGDWGSYTGSFNAGLGHFDFSATINDYEPWVPVNTFAHNTNVWRARLAELVDASCEQGACQTAAGTRLSTMYNGADVLALYIEPNPDGDVLAQYRETLTLLAPLLPSGQADQVLGWVEDDQTAPLELDGLLAKRTDTGISISCHRHLPRTYPVWLLPGVEEAATALADTLADTSGGREAWLARLAPLTTSVGLATLGANDVAGHGGQPSASSVDGERVRRAGSMSEFYVQAGGYRYDVGFVRVDGVWLADMFALA